MVTSNMLMHRIIRTLSKEALVLVIGLDTTLAVWEALKDAYAQDSQE
jgi:hypothetical protein